ncbi:dockerin type I domain-containing protein [Stieleria varia]|uniref:Dockerin type I repeat protein n=1 Tax=Stieleria varia TaxID=2528005 RepID=A0A5C6AYM3_9BACT|nr:dockerin type I domain-containing protein [Stieleria varia]TWU04259.1 Dockerin type I repeat protein [Stieleria varia]
MTVEQLDYDATFNNREWLKKKHLGVVRSEYRVTNSSDRTYPDFKLRDRILDDPEPSVNREAFDTNPIVRGQPAFAVSAGAARGALISDFVSHPSQDWLIGFSEDDETLSIIDMSTHQLIKKVWVGNYPTGFSFSPDDRELFVATNLSNQITVIATTSWTIVRTIELPYAASTVFASAGGQLFVGESQRLHVLDPKNGMPLAPPLTGVVDATLSDNGRTLFISPPPELDVFAESIDVSVLVGESPVRKQWGVGHKGGGRIEVSESGRYITETFISRTFVLDTTIDDPPRDFSYAYDFVISHDERFAYLSSTDRILVLNLDLGSVVAEMDTQDLYRLALSHDDRYLITSTAGSYGAGFRTTGRFRDDPKDFYSSWDKVFDPGETWEFTYKWAYGVNRDRHAGATFSAEVSTVFKPEGGNEWSAPQHVYTAEIDKDALKVHAYTASGEVVEPSVFLGTSFGHSIVTAGSNVVWNISVEKIGLLDAVNLQVLASVNGGNSVEAKYISGDQRRDGIMAESEKWEFTVTHPAAEGIQTIELIITADTDAPVKLLRRVLSATGPIVAHMGLEFDFDLVATDEMLGSTRAQDLSSVTAGDSLRWDYRLTNTGNFPLKDITFFDTRGANNDALAEHPGNTELIVLPPDDEERAAMRGYLGTRRFSDAAITAISMHLTKPLIFIADQNGKKIQKFEATSFSTIDAVPFDFGSASIVQLLPAGASRMLARTSDHEVWELNIDSMQWGRQVLAPSTDQMRGAIHDLTFSPEGEFFLLSDHGIERFDHTGNVLMETIPTPRQDVGTIAVYGGRLYYRNGFNSQLVCYDIGAAATIERWRTPAAERDLLQPHASGIEFSQDSNGNEYVIADTYVPGLNLAIVTRRRVSDGFNLGGFNAFIGDVHEETAKHPADGTSYTRFGSDSFSSWSKVYDYLTGHRSPNTLIARNDLLGIRLSASRNEVHVAAVAAANELVYGDVNHNQLLDPGETWHYQLWGAAVAGNHRIDTRVTVQSPLGDRIILNDFVSYRASVVSESVEVRAAANVRGLKFFEVSDVLDEVLEGFVSADTRFYVDGGVFRLREDAVLTLEDNGLTVAVHDNVLGLKRFVVTFIVQSNPRPYRNALLRFDVNSDGIVTALDALLIVNALSEGPGRTLPAIRNPGEWYWDVSGDNRVSALDALQVINELARQKIESESLSLETLSLGIVDPLSDSMSDSMTLGMTLGMGVGAQHSAIVGHWNKNSG